MGDAETLALITGALDEIRGDLRGIKQTLDGERGRLGLVAKVEIVWRSWVWLLCTLSAAVGSLATYIATVVMAHA